MPQRLKIGLLLVFAGAIQDPVETLVERMASDDPAVRSQATRDLVERGESVRARMQELAASGDGETAGRARAVLEELDLRKKLSQLFGEKPTYEVRVSDRPAAEVLAKLGEEAKLNLKLRGVPEDARLSLEAASSNPYELIDRICDACGKIRFDPRTLKISSYGAAPQARVYQDLWGVHLTGLQDLAQHMGGAGFVATWRTATPPSSVTVDCESVVTDDIEELAGKPTFSLGHWRTDPPCHTSFLWVKAPPKGSRTATLTGKASFHYAIDWSAADVGAPGEEEPVKTTQTAFGEVKVVRASKVGGIVYFEVHIQPAGGSSPFVGLIADKVNWIDGEGKKRPARVIPCVRTKIPALWSYRVRLDVPENTRPDKLEIGYPTKLHTVAVPFEFKDVPIRGSSE